MEKNMYITEAKQDLTVKHNIALRNLYLPIIGMEAITIYSLLCDSHYMNKANPSYTPLEDLTNTSRINILDFMTAKSKLEAVGLIRTFENANNTHFLFILNPPLLPEEFRNNNTLYSDTIKQVGEVVFERIYFSTRETRIKKDNFKEITSKYHDVFEIKTNKFTTLEIPMVNFANKVEAIKGTNSSQFIKYISGEKVSPTQLRLIQRLNNSGLSSQSMNEIIDYTYEINGKVVSNHIETIANDMISKNITNPNDIRVEMNNAKKNNKPTDSNVINVAKPNIKEDIS